MSDFLHMGGYAAFVWGSYAAFIGALAWNLLTPRFQRGEVERRLRDANRGDDA